MARASSKSLDRFLEELWRVGGSDLLLTAGAPPLARIDGLLAPLEGFKALTAPEVDQYVRSTLTPELTAEFDLHKEVDFSFSWENSARFRANAFLQRGSCALSLRLIPYRIPTFSELGLPAVVEQLVAAKQGLILVTGPTGSGKSTTLASMIDYINEQRACHILTIEDPIEYVHRHKRSAVNQREVGEDTQSFHRALRSALREDPDVLLLGEMRDLETIETALTIAETGHLVLATLHTNDTAQALDRIVDVFPGDRQPQIRLQMANALSAIFHQRLVPSIGGGRVAAFEVLLATHPVRNLVLEGKSRQLRNAVTNGQRDGMQTLEMSLNALMDAGLISYEQAMAHSLHPKEIGVPRTPARR